MNNMNEFLSLNRIILLKLRRKKKQNNTLKYKLIFIKNIINLLFKKKKNIYIKIFETDLLIYVNKLKYLKLNKYV